MSRSRLVVPPTSQKSNLYLPPDTTPETSLTLVSAIINETGDELRITWSDIITDYTGNSVSISGTAATINSYGTDGNDLVVTLNGPVLTGETVLVSVDGGAVSHDALTNDPIIDYPATNHSTEDGTFEFVSATINEAGDELTVTWTKSVTDVSGGNDPYFLGLYGSSEAQPSGSNTSGNDIIVSLSPPALNNEVFTLFIFAGTVSHGAITNSEVDNAPVTNNSTQDVPFTFDSAYVNESGNYLRITFSNSVISVIQGGVTLSGTTATVDSYTPDGHDVAVNLIGTVLSTDVVTVSAVTGIAVDSQNHDSPVLTNASVTNTSTQ